MTVEKIILFLEHITNALKWVIVIGVVHFFARVGEAIANGRFLP